MAPTDKIEDFIYLNNYILMETLSALLLKQPKDRIKLLPAIFLRIKSIMTLIIATIVPVTILVSVMTTMTLTMAAMIKQ